MRFLPLFTGVFLLAWGVHTSLLRSLAVAFGVILIAVAVSGVSL